MVSLVYYFYLYNSPKFLQQIQCCRRRLLVCSRLLSPEIIMKVFNTDGSEVCAFQCCPNVKRAALSQSIHTYTHTCIHACIHTHLLELL